MDYKNVYYLASPTCFGLSVIFRDKKVNQSHYRPEWPTGFQEVKAPRFHDNGTGRWQGCQPYAPATFTPRKYSWYSFLLEAELTPGP